MSHNLEQLLILSSSMLQQLFSFIILSSFVRPALECKKEESRKMVQELDGCDVQVFGNCLALIFLSFGAPGQS